jgi:hypothetical protein
VRLLRSSRLLLGKEKAWRKTPAVSVGRFRQSYQTFSRTPFACHRQIGLHGGRIIGLRPAMGPALICQELGRDGVNATRLRALWIQ